jgi:hypothetical protein
VPAGYYTDPGSNIIKLCNDVVTEKGVDPISYYCPGGLVGEAQRLTCDSSTASANGVYSPPDASTTADCWSLLKPGYYFSGAQTAAACPADSYW